MASHVRYLLSYGGHMYAGPVALEILKESVMGASVKTKVDIITAFNKLKATGVGKPALWIFREKRHSNSKNSRYKKLCLIYGIGRPKKQRLAWVGNEALPVPLAFQYQVQYVIGGAHGNNQQPGLAPAPRRANRAVQAIPQGGQGNAAGNEW